MSQSMPVLIVSSALRQYVRKQRLMEDAEFGLMLAAALDAIHASVMDGLEWSSRVLSNDNFLCLDNNGGEWTFVWHVPHAKKQRLHNDVVATSEKSEVASSEMTEASEKCEASLKSVDKGQVMSKSLVVNAWFKSAMSHTDFCMMIGDAVNAISASENHAREWISHPSYNGDVFSLFRSGVLWYLELGPQAKGNRMKGGVSGTSSQPWKQREGQGPWQALRCPKDVHGVSEPM